VSVGEAAGPGQRPTGRKKRRTGHRQRYVGEAAAATRVGGGGHMRVRVSVCDWPPGRGSRKKFLFLAAHSLSMAR
jgi:hypothetical protein